jgi:hypothetical protein
MASSRLFWKSFIILTAALSWIPAARAQECDAGEFDSTYALIQKVIFENRGCAESICHGAAQEGGLDLRAGVSYANLIDVPSESVPGYSRVRPGRKDGSLLWLNLAAKTLPQQYTAPLRPMPLDPVPALSENELEAIRLWIEGGAPEAGVIEGTGELLDACLPPPGAVEVKPLPPPDPNEGVQIRMPRWSLSANREREVCLASYFDITEQVPEEFRGEDGTTFRFNRNEVRQSAGSHHLIVNLYTGSAQPNDPRWGTFYCVGGPRDGEVCPPTDLDFCGEGGLCGTRPVTGVACQGFGPGDSGLGLNSSGISGTQETSSLAQLAPGVYREVPLKGMILWNHHSFNLTDEPAPMEAWLNFDFAAPEEQLYPVQIIFNTQEIFGMNVPVFGTQEICSGHQLPQGAYLYELSSHAHQRMKRWRTFLGRWQCNGGAADGQACSPMGYDLDSPDVCQGAPCEARERPRSGDCNADLSVTVDEVIRSVNIALGLADIGVCHEADVDASWSISVDEIVTAVNAALEGVPGRKRLDAEESLLYLSFLYNDPLVLPVDPPIVMSGRPQERWLTYCALYDNGFTDPEEVKRRSTSPNPPIPIAPLGGPCATPTGCTAGKVGAPCAGRSQTERNQSCDTSEGAGDGFCDACTLRGGVTTEDEMFILMGQYYVP